VDKSQNVPQGERKKETGERHDHGGQRNRGWVGTPKEKNKQDNGTISKEKQKKDMWVKKNERISPRRAKLWSGAWWGGGKEINDG